MDGRQRGQGAVGRLPGVRDAKAAARQTAARVPGAQALWDRVQGRHRGEILQHRAGRRRPSISGAIIPDKIACEQDVVIAARLLAAYHASTSDGIADPSSNRPDIWTDIRERQDRFISILERSDPEELAGYLCNISRHDATHGIAQGNIEFERVKRDFIHRRRATLLTHDKLVSLAEAVGALPVENPEQGVFGASLYNDPAHLIDAIQRRLGFDIMPPDVDGGMFKLQSGHGTIGERDLSALYSALLLRRASDSTSPRVCEIGGGAGRMAYWSHRLGLTSYTIIDLPLVNVVQGYYLLKTVPPDRVLLYGEDDASTLGDSLRVLPNHAIGKPHVHEYDIVFNQDSFPEMDSETVMDYLTWIKSCCRGELMSINQESKPPYGDGLAHVSVPEAIEKTGGFELRQRFPYWLRKGYVLETYRVGG